MNDDLGGKSLLSEALDNQAAALKALVIFQNSPQGLPLTAVLFDSNGIKDGYLATSTKDPASLQPPSFNEVHHLQDKNVGPFNFHAYSCSNLNSQLPGKSKVLDTTSSHSKVPCSLTIDSNFNSSTSLANDTSTLVLKKRSRLLKPFPKHFARRKSSFLNTWSTIVNSDLLEECCVKIQAPGLPNRSANLSPQTCSFTHSDFQVPGSNVHFVQGIPSNSQIDCRSNKHDSDGDSIDSTSSEDLENSDMEEAQDEEAPQNDFGTDICQLFHSDAFPQIRKNENFSLPPINKMMIPQNLQPLVEDCDFIFG